MRGNVTIFLFISIVTLASMAVPVFSQEPLNVSCIRQFEYNWHAATQDVVVQGDYAFVTCDYEGFRIINISEPNSYFDLARLEVGRALDVVVDGQFAYIGVTELGVIVVDISEKSQPSIISTVTFPYNNYYHYNIRKFGTLVYSCTDHGLTIIDVSNPSEPLILSSITGFEGTDVCVRDDRAYVACGYDGLKIFNIADICSPQLLETYHPESSYLEGVSLYQNYAVVAASWSGFQIVDLASLQLVADIDTLRSARWVKVQGDYAYLAYGYPECPLAIINISNPTAPQLISIYYPPEDIANFTVAGELVYVADYTHGLRTVDISDKSNPVETVPYNRYGFERKIAWNGAYVYSMSTYKLTSFDLSDPSNPVELAYFESNWELTDFKFAGDIAYVLSGEPTVLSAIDFSEPSDPEILDQILPGGYYNYYKFSIYENFLYLDSYSDLLIFDISDPSNITPSGSYAISDYMHTPYVFDHYMALQNSFNEIILFDLTNPLSPQIVSNFAISEYCCDMRVKGNLLFATSSTKVHVIDITDPVSWRLLDEKSIGSDNLYQGTYCDIYDNFLFLASGTYGMEVYDISTPDSIVLVGFYDTPGNALSVAAKDNIALIADNRTIGIYDCSQAQGIERGNDPVYPSQITLLPNYPNPFNNSTVIRFETGYTGNVAIDILDILGRKITTLTKEIYEPGLHSIRWDGSDKNGQSISSGQYYVRVQSGPISKSLPITLLK